MLALNEQRAVGIGIRLQANPFYLMSSDSQSAEKKALTDSGNCLPALSAIFSLQVSRQEYHGKKSPKQTRQQTRGRRLLLLLIIATTIDVIYPRIQHFHVLARQSS
jgi:hypothetical protein